MLDTKHVCPCSRVGAEQTQCMAYVVQLTPSVGVGAALGPGNVTGAHPALDCETGTSSDQKWRPRPCMIQTVIPKAGGLLRVLQGPHRNSDAKVRKINVDAFSVTVELPGGEITELPYEDISKLA